jgi:AraC-like DNA-binding protein
MGQLTSASPSAAVPALPRHYALGLLRGAESHGYEADDLLERAGIPSGLCDAPDAGLSGTQAQRLVLTLRETLDDTYLGFLDERAKLAMDAEVGAVALKFGSLGAAITGMCDFVEAIRNDQERHLSINDRNEEYTYAIRASRAGQPENDYYFHYYRLGWIYRFLCWLVGKRIPLVRVSFAAPPPDGRLAEEALFGCPTAHGCEWNSLNFHRKFLDAPVIRTHEEYANKDYPGRYPDWFELPGWDLSMSRQVEKALTELYKMEIPFPPVDVAAKVLSVSPRNLRRQLAAEGDSYRAIKERLRRQLAETMLMKTNLPIAAIANEVGYSEPGVFSRAFVGWTGVTPSTFRREATREDGRQPG